jgi:hypothetical protein
MYHARMTQRELEAIYQFVLERAGYYSGEPPDEIKDRLLYADLRIDGWDSADLCEELERRYRIDLTPFFEIGQSTRGWLFWKHKVVRDVTVQELAHHVVTLAANVTSVKPDASPQAG